jgi:hypothetical protein
LETDLISLASYELERFHVVLTTYDVLASEYAAFQDPTGEVKASKSKSKEAPTPTGDSSDSDGFGGSLKARRDALIKANARPRKIKEKASPLFDVNWLRVVVGETKLTLLMTCTQSVQTKRRTSRIGPRRDHLPLPLWSQSIDGP